MVKRRHEVAGELGTLGLDQAGVHVSRHPRVGVPEHGRDLRQRRPGREQEARARVPEVENLRVAPVPGYKPGTGAGLTNDPFYGPGSLESAPRVITGRKPRRPRPG